MPGDFKAVFSRLRFDTLMGVDKITIAFAQEDRNKP
jgi:hypothetical protein